MSSHPLCRTSFGQYQAMYVEIYVAYLLVLSHVATVLLVTVSYNVSCVAGDSV